MLQLPSHFYCHPACSRFVIVNPHIKCNGDSGAGLEIGRRVSGEARRRMKRKGLHVFCGGCGGGCAICAMTASYAGLKIPQKSHRFLLA